MKYQGLKVLRSYGLMVLLFIFLSSVLVGCDKINAWLNPKKTQTKKLAEGLVVKGTVIAKVNNISITLEDLNQEIDTYNAMVPQDKPELKITTREKKIDYLKNDMIRRALLYQEALDRGLDRNEEVVRALEKSKMDLLAVELIRQEAEKIEVTAKEIEDYYNTYKEQLKEPQERHIREIVVPTETEARDILIQILQGVDFATLARERSKSSSAKEGGDLGFIQRGKKFLQFDTVAFSDTLEKGKVSNIFKGPEGYYILKVEDIRGGKQKSLSEMWDDIKRGLIFVKQQQRIEDLIGKLSREAKIEIYEGQIK
ncbi:MAG: peptidylprolyl isomerase [Candidatus Omnitrophica bacterium]|nr:peptidylprolyl isomerase [Candidatus Omnitrophota bacterium]